MARARVRAQVRKAALRQLARATATSEPEMVAAGVLAVAREIEPLIKPGSLYFAGPFQYVAEQMAPRVCRAHNVDVARVDDVAGYLLAAMNEFAVALVGEFDVAHFEQWTAAAARQEGANRV